MGIFESTGNLIIAMGKTIAHSLWIGLFIFSTLKLILYTIPDKLSGLRYNISLLSLFLFLGLVLTLFFFLYVPGLSIQGSHAVFNISQIVPPGLIEFVNDSEGSKSTLIFTCCTYLYFAGIPIMLIRSVRSVHYLRIMKRSGDPVEGIWQMRFFQLKNSLGIKRAVNLLESKSLKVPALVGFLKPVVLIPAGILTHLSVSQVETILMHELYHLRRFDFVINVVQLFAEGVFFYNPGVWGISNLIRSERENCCDDRVLKACGDPLNYAKALFHLAGQNQALSHLAPGAGGTNHFQLFKRIKRILNETTMKKNMREKLFSLLLLAGGAIILVTITGFSSGFSIVKNNESRQEAMVSPAVIAAVPDTVPRVEKEEIEKARQEALEEIDWKELIDWEELKEEMELAKAEALEEIDWDEIKEEMAASKVHLDSIMKDFDFDFDFDFDIDMEDLRIDMEEVMKGFEEIEFDIDIEQIRENVKRSLEEIDWDEFKEEIRQGE